MLIFSIILLFVYLFFSKQIKDPLLKKILYFLIILYGAQICMAIWDPYQVYKVSFITVVLFNIQIMCLIMGANLCKRTKTVKDISRHNFSWPSIEINKLLLVVVTIFFLYSYYNYNRMQSFLIYMANTSDEGREYYFTMFFPTYTLRVIDMFITSFKYVAFIVSITLLFKNGIKLKLKEVYFIALTILAYILQLLTSQSRTETFVVLFMLILMAFISSVYDAKKYKKRVLPFMAFAVIGIGAVFLSVTLLRANLKSDGFDESLVDELILQPFSTYFYVPILAFDYTRNTLLNFGFPLFGCATFSAVVDTILLPLTYIDHGFGAYTMNTVLGNTIGTGMYFPSGKHWMAMFTGCANYYLDFWYLGFIIFPLLHGWVLAKLVYTFRTKAFSFILLAFMFYASFRHATASGIQSVDTVFFLFWAYLACKSKAVSYHNSLIQGKH